MLRRMRLPLSIQFYIELLPHPPSTAVSVSITPGLFPLPTDCSVGRSRRSFVALLWCLYYFTVKFSRCFAIMSTFNDIEQTVEQTSVK